MRGLSFCLCCLFIMVLLSGCDDDGYKGTYPSVVLEFATVQADDKGHLAFLLTDEQEVLLVLEDRTQTKIEPREQKRVVCNYEMVESKEGIIIYSLSGTLTSSPVPRKELEVELKENPVSVQSSWLGSDFLNLIMQIRVADARKHKFSFIEDNYFTDGTTSQVDLVLYHDDGGDEFAHTDRAYFSVPLHKYLNNERVTEIKISFSYFDYSGKRRVEHFVLKRK